MTSKTRRTLALIEVLAPEPVPQFWTEHTHAVYRRGLELYARRIESGVADKFPSTYADNSKGSEE